MPGPGWAAVYPAATAVIVFALLIPVVNLIRPTWTRFRVAGHAAVDVAVIVLGIVVAGARQTGSSSPTRRSATADLGELIATINTIVRISIAATVVLTVITTALEFRRLLRMRTREPEATPAPSGS